MTCISNKENGNQVLPIQHFEFFENIGFNRPILWSSIHRSVLNVCVPYMWAGSWPNQQNGMCAQRRLRSAWASVQSDQSLLCVQWVDKDQSFLHADSEDWSDWENAQAFSQSDLILRWANSHFIGFVMRRLIFMKKSAASYSSGDALKLFSQCAEIQLMLLVNFMTSLSSHVLWHHRCTPIRLKMSEPVTIYQARQTGASPDNNGLVGSNIQGTKQEFRRFLMIRKTYFCNFLYFFF